MQVRKNPSAYCIPGNRLSEGDVEKVLKDQLILSNVRELAKYGMVRWPPKKSAACNSITISAALALYPHSLLGVYHVVTPSCFHSSMHNVGVQVFYNVY